ncbi:succinylglutamate desuccinylase/aspartoacylase family protein [Myxococcota bacterium]|nr:succinylglutamate desuccinylase/aspartoacylase family protein [Myxococcota bacterium]
MTVVFRMEAPYRGAYELHRLSFGSGSPSVAIVAGMHGYELTGLHAVNMLATALRVSRPKGTVHLLPLVNTFGADENQKRWPFDDQDINHAFPGDPAGTAVQRIAHALLEATHADVCVDVHSGAPHVRELPHVRVPMGGEEVELGRKMGLPVVWRRPGDRLDATGLVGAWRQAGHKAVVIEGGRGGTLDTQHSELIARGLGALLGHLHILPAMPGPGVLADVTHSEVETHRAPFGGFFVPEVKVGQRVQAGHLLGYLQAPIGGDRLGELRAERPGVVMTLRAYPMVHASELLVRVAGIPQ